MFLLTRHCFVGMYLRKTDSKTSAELDQFGRPSILIMGRLLLFSFQSELNRVRPEFYKRVLINSRLFSNETRSNVERALFIIKSRRQYLKSKNKNWFFFRNVY